MAAKLSLLCLAAPALGLVARGPALPTYAARAGVAPMAMRTSVIGGNWCVRCGDGPRLDSITPERS